MVPAAGCAQWLPGVTPRQGLGHRPHLWLPILPSPGELCFSGEEASSEPVGIGDLLVFDATVESSLESQQPLAVCIVFRGALRASGGVQAGLGSGPPAAPVFRSGLLRRVFLICSDSVGRVPLVSHWGGLSSPWRSGDLMGKECQGHFSFRCGHFHQSLFSDLDLVPQPRAAPCHPLLAPA